MKKLEIFYSYIASDAGRAYFVRNERSHSSIDRRAFFCERLALLPCELPLFSSSPSAPLIRRFCEFASPAISSTDHCVGERKLKGPFITNKIVIASSSMSVRFGNNFGVIRKLTRCWEERHGGKIVRRYKSRKQPEFSHCTYYCPAWAWGEPLGRFVEFSTIRLKTKRSLRSSKPWLISSTQRKGDNMRSCMAIKYIMVLTDRSPPD